MSERSLSGNRWCGPVQQDLGEDRLHACAPSLEAKFAKHSRRNCVDPTVGDRPRHSVDFCSCGEDLVDHKYHGTPGR